MVNIPSLKELKISMLNISVKPHLTHQVSSNVIAVAQ
jgi:hypothetical protein